MIRINLLPVKSKRKQRNAVVQLAAFAAAAVLALALAAGAVYYFGSIVDERVATIEKNKAQIKQLEEDVGEVKKVEEQTELLKKQLGVIDSLKRGNKLGPVRILDALAENIPKRVWLTEITEKGRNAQLKGVGLENADVSEFLRQLQKNRFFTNVRLDLTRATSRNGAEIFNFTILAQVNYGG